MVSTAAHSGSSLARARSGAKLRRCSRVARSGTTPPWRPCNTIWLCTHSPTRPRDGSNTATANKLFLYEKTAGSSEGGTNYAWVFASSCIATIHFYELSLPNNQIEVTFATATDDPPNHTPSAGTNDYIFIAVACSRQNTMNADAAPLGYSNLIYTESSTTNSSSNGEVAMATARVFKNAVPSENPDPFTWTGARTTPIAATISCR